MGGAVDTVIVERFDGEEELSNGLVVVEGLEVFGYSEEIDFDLPGTEGMALTSASCCRALCPGREAQPRG